MSLLLGAGGRGGGGRAEGERDTERARESRLCRIGWLSCPKGFPLAKPHPKAQEVQSLAPSQGESIPQDSDKLWGMVVVFLPQGWGRGRKRAGEEMTSEGKRWGTSPSPTREGLRLDVFPMAMRRVCSFRANVP